MPKTYVVEYRRQGCISATYCVEVDPRDWELGDDVKANLIRGVQEQQSGLWVREIGEDELPAMLDAAKGCPVKIIRIRDKQTGEYLV